MLFLCIAAALLFVVIILLVARGRGAKDMSTVARATVAPTIAPELTPDPTPDPIPDPTEIPTAVPLAPASSEGEYSTNYEADYAHRTTNRPLGLQECAPVSTSYFNDAVFIGDSVSLKLYYYVRNQRANDPNFGGNCEFLVAGSMGSGNALKPVSKDSIHPTYRGEKMLLEDAVAKMGAKKVYIMLGMNDIAQYGVEKSAEQLMLLVRRILEKSPGAQIFIQSMTPRMKGDYQKLNNDNIFAYNLLLYKYCVEYQQYGLHFVDVAYVMRNADGDLPAEYCSDPDGMKMHFRDVGCKAWLDYVVTHALVS